MTNEVIEFPSGIISAACRIETHSLVGGGEASEKKRQFETFSLEQLCIGRKGFFYSLAKSFLQTVLPPLKTDIHKNHNSITPSL
jgi:hypothetical protein